MSHIKNFLDYFIDFPLLLVTISANVLALHAGCRLRRVNISVNYYYLQVQDNV